MTEESLFAAAIALSDTAARAAYLDRACGGDLDLRQRLDALVSAHFAADPVLDPATVHRPVVSEGDRVGPYKLLEKIGEGGMGEVWVADQQEPIKRRVALKLIKPGMDSRSVLGRFEAERQALAVMDHPNIAKVLDAGTTADGRPYFVMELVKGTPITEFADARKLTTQQRLELFVPVCQAIQHAHMKGIIHRDIKPSNVLVALHDETPVPKVIDFGVAKAVGQQLTEKTVYTGFGSLVGTPTYMAPEQATFNQLDVDTRADVYALGVLLYELLAGSPPIEKERLKRAALDEVLRIVREEEPPRPSQRLSTADTRASIAATRGSEPAKLSALMKGELDWIVMKALEKDRTRRYETANGFAADVQRYLNGEQVQAVPPSVGYRLRKWWRKNRTAGLVACAFAGLICGAATVAFLLAVQAIAAERRAVEERNTAEMERANALAAQAQAEAAAAAEKVATKRAVEFRNKALNALRATTGGDVDKLFSSKPELGANEKAYLEAMARRWQRFADQEGTDEESRAVRAEGHYRFAALWERLGRLEEARPEYEQALRIREKLVADFPTAPDHRRDLSSSHSGLGLLLDRLGKQVEAEDHLRLALEVQAKLATDFPTVATHRLVLAAYHNNLGYLLNMSGKREEAEGEYRKALAIWLKHATEIPATRDTLSRLASSHVNLGTTLQGLKRWEDAEEQYRKALAIQEKLAADSPANSNYWPQPTQQSGSTHYSLGQTLSSRKKWAEAEQHFRKALALQEAAVGEAPGDPYHRQRLSDTYLGLGCSVRDGGRPADSLGWFQKAIDTLRPIHEAAPADKATKQFLQRSYRERGFAYSGLGKKAEAVKDWERVINLGSRDGPPNSRSLRACSMALVGRVAEAVAEVAELRKLPGWDEITLYNFACVYSVASDKIADKKMEYADAAMEMLQKAVKDGFSYPSDLKTDTDLDPLRDRDDFQTLLAELEKKFPPKPETLPAPRRE